MRNKVLDAVRGLGILLVILGHTNGRPQLLMKFIYSFHMPLFFFVSGYLFNVEKFRKFRWRDFLLYKGRRYIQPYFAFAFTFYLLFVVLPEARAALGGAPVAIQPLEKYLVGIFYSRGTAAWLPVSSPLWFLTALFMTELFFFAVLKLTRTDLARFWLIGLLAFLGYLTSLKLSVKIPWNADTALTALAFFYAGRVLRAKGFVSVPIGLRAIGAAALVSFFAVRYNHIIVSFDDNRYGDGLLMYAGALAGILLAFALAQRLSEGRFLRFLGRNTLLIMGLDFAVLRLVNILLAKVGPAWLLSFILQVLIISLVIVGLRKVPSLYRLYSGKVDG
ncbi:Acyltransferase family [Acididesulfobacillus acetoxydans]|uniref:Acyltransferase family n=1 Tax=Acididesulfobacillus acetoxydans TaxID=1561005 RepID=A0A8S0VVI9_9FIRM|nr:acyltransferase family protein [Acididesulfobacillus acetoxydans]CAA7599593.1 Acyltransferase family [Acididesulfobacillus acetoxydans]CEJ07788.1 Acyltransferase family [Acididesulfobacillus acetoxydans]